MTVETEMVAVLNLINYYLIYLTVWNSNRY